ncbi:MAG: type VI secretion system protein TssA [Curvibacter sp.]|nr:type VI secretion system protein TssA [Curvibacter sp.]
MTDLEELLAPSAVDPPCGPDPSYSAEFMALESVVRGKPEQQFGSTVIAAEPPDWRDVEKRAGALLRQAKDLRVASLLCRAWLNLQGLAGLAAGLELLGGLLDRYGDALHPLPEEGDHFMRLNALAALDEVTGALQELRNAELLRASFGVVTVREAECSLKGLPAPGSDRTAPLESLRLAMAEAQHQGQAPAAALARAQAALAQVLATCERLLPAQQQLELKNLDSLLRLLLSLQPTARSTDAAPGGTAVEAVSGPTPAPLADPASAALRSRDDAIARLLEITEFIERTEPASPAPLLIRRAVRLMRMGFMDILRELSPDSLSQVETITGVRAQAAQD